MSSFLRRLLGGGRGRRWPASWPSPGDPRRGPERVKHGASVDDSDLPRASIVILNYNGRHHLERVFKSLGELDYPQDRYEVILIDNASSDESVQDVQRYHGWVRLVVNERNVGFSAGCNQGARLAKDPEVLVFLNNDMRVESGWLRALVGPIVRAECQASTAKMFSWDGKEMNSAGGGMNFHGIGIQKGYGEEPRPEHDLPARSLFACGGAMAIDAGVFDDVGGFDEEFFAYYEDVDLGWRMWVLGHEVHYVPEAVCYHHHSSTSRTFPLETIRLLQTRNPILACFKNYSDENLATILPAMLALGARRTFLVSGVEDDSSFRIEGATPHRAGVVGRTWERARRSMGDSSPIRREALADMVGINDLLGRWDHWEKRRRAVQERRKRTDAEIFKLFHKPLWCIEEESSYRELHEGLIRFLGVERLFRGSSAPGSDPRK